jgi:hypothetical protein
MTRVKPDRVTLPRQGPALIIIDDGIIAYGTSIRHTKNGWRINDRPPFESQGQMAELGPWLENLAVSGYLEREVDAIQVDPVYAFHLAVIGLVDRQTLRRAQHDTTNERIVLPDGFTLLREPPLDLWIVSTEAQEAGAQQGRPIRFFRYGFRQPVDTELFPPR